MSANNAEGKLVVAPIPGSDLFNASMEGIAFAQSLTEDVARRIAACWNAFDGVPTEKIEGKTVSEYICGEAYLEGMTPSGGSLHMGLTGTACQMLAESFAGQFVGSGATNFVEVAMSHKELGPFTVTIQRTHGETPAQQKAAALARLDNALTLLSDALETFDDIPHQDHEIADRIRAFLKGGAA